MPSQLKGLFLITLHPNHLASALLEQVDLLIAVGQQPSKTLHEFAQATGRKVPSVAETPLPPGEALAWWVNTSGPILPFTAIPPKTVRRRHIRKYMNGELIPEEQFLFEGPERKLKLRAQNLSMFLQMAEGVDDETWQHHLHRGDYSRWFHTVIKDAELGAAAENIEKNGDLPPGESRNRIRSEIENRYTAPE